MNLQLVAPILLSVALSSGSQIILKKGMVAPAMQASLQSGNMLAIALAIITSPLVIGGLFCFGLSAIVWLFVLSKVPLSSAYPFVALGIVVTVAAGMTIFGETITVTKSIGVGFVVLGILCVAAQA
ncbi:EamA family transporter [Asticcacaulis machinosus]|uniref:EamA family transporter n=1 Tax=Asticcacaulis machinosus TaxID=2984211 RepID=A0ABT5HIN3_9CAUL|nr:EamA family transporter [Asticcacaulis machinosus]MDC7675459.1 EamA family transporter [Asticcacaulis machinosus]